MADIEKNIIVQPNVGVANTAPKIDFISADASSNAKTISLKVYPTSNGTLSFEGNTGQLFSITDSMSGTIFSVNDVSGIPSIEVLDTGLIKFGQYSGNVLLGTGTDNGSKLQINGTVSATTFSGSGASLTSLPAANLLGTIPSAVLGASSLYIGTTAVALNRASASLALTGITSIDGSAASVASSITFNTSGGAAAGASYNGSAARTIDYSTVGAAASSHTHSYLPLSGGTLTGSLSLINSTNEMTLTMGSSGGYWYGNATNTGFFKSGGGHVYITIANGNINTGGSITASSFYDSNNTGYYVDPNSTSNILNLTLNGTQNFPSGGGGATFSSDHYSMGKDVANGSWSHPHYADLIIGYHTGIRLGAAYSGIRFYNNSPTTDANNDGNGDGGEALLMTIGGHAGGTGVIVNNTLTAGADARAPIFYDSNNTGYYVDPNGITNLGGVNDRPLRVLKTSGVSSACAIFENQYGDNSWGIVGEFRVGSGSGTDRASILFSNGYDTNTWSAGFGGSDSSYFRIRYDHGHRNNSWGTEAIAIDRSSNLFANGSCRSPIFYDSNNTGYYVDPNSTSNIYGLTVNQTITGSVSGNAGTVGSVAISNICSGNNGTATSDAVSDMNSTTAKSGFYIYNNPTNAPTATWQTWLNASGHYAGDRYGWQLSHGYWDNDLWVRGVNSNSWRLWRKILDSNNYTSYAMPAGASATNSVDIRAPRFYDSNDTAYYTDPASGTRLGGTTHCDYLYSGGDVRAAGYVYAVGRVVVGEGQTSSMIEMRDTDESTRYVHNNSSTIGFLGSAGTWRFKVADDGNVVMGTYQDWLSTQIRSGIFYDHNDTGYYVDPNSTSNMIRFSVYSTDTTSHSYGGSLGSEFRQWPGGTGCAGFSFHRNGAYAVNMALDNDNIIRIGGWSASANRLQMDMSGNLTMAGNVTAYSDIRLKENIETIENSIEKIKQIRGVTFTRNDQDDKTKRHAGVIAQEVEVVLPEVISEDNEGIKNVAYGNMIGLLIEAIKEQQIQIEQQSIELNNLKSLLKVE